MVRFYVDTCIWRDYAEGRTDRFRPLGDWALAFLMKVKEEGSKIIISELVIEELERYYGVNATGDLLQLFAPNVTTELISQKQRQEAHRLGKKINTHFADTLHAIVARDNNAILITRDKHFVLLQSIVKIKKPEELL